jgi:hypothetical protein
MQRLRSSTCKETTLLLLGCLAAASASPGQAQILGGFTRAGDYLVRIYSVSRFERGRPRRPLKNDRPTRSDHERPPGRDQYTFDPGSSEPGALIRIAIESTVPGAIQAVQGLSPNLRAFDDQGLMATPYPPSPYNTAETGGNRRIETVELRLPRAQTKGLRALDGEILVRGGTVRNVRFARNEIRPGATRHLGGVVITILQVIPSSLRYEVIASVEQPGPAPAAPPTTPPLTASLQDAHGYQRSPHAVKPSSNYPQNNFPLPPPQRPGFGRIHSTWSFSFPTLSQGLPPASLNFQAQDAVGLPRRIPFRFINIPVQ